MVPFMSKTLAQLFALTTLAASSALAVPAHAAENAAATSAAAAACPAILKQTFKRLQDEVPQNLCQYAGKVVLW